MKEYDALFVSVPSAAPGMYFAYSQQGMPPLGLAYIATFIREFGYVSKIIDLSHPFVTLSTLIDFLEGNTVRIVGLSCSTEAYNTAVRLSSIIKRIYPDVVIVLGGYHVSFEYETTLKNNDVDYVVIGEGELVFKQICDAIIRKEGKIFDVKGIAYKNSGKIIKTQVMPFINDLDSLPIPDRSFFDNLHEYPIPATISTSRGCPGKCIFCSASALSGGRYRLRSADNIVSEFEYLYSFGFNHICVIDDTMTADLKRLDGILDKLIKKRIGVTWYCESRVDSLSKSVLVKMKDAGVVAIQFGVESGSQSILDCIKKNIKIEQILRVFEWCHELGISTMTNFIVGLPSDTHDTIQKSNDLANVLIEKGASVTFSICTPFPGTPIWIDPNKYEIKIENNDLDFYTTSCPVFSTKNLSLQDIRNEYYNSIKQLGPNFGVRIYGNPKYNPHFVKFFPAFKCLETETSNEVK